MKLLQHALAPLWPHFGTPVCTCPNLRPYPHKIIQNKLKEIDKQVELILPGLRRIRHAPDFEAESTAWQMLRELLLLALHDMPQLLGTNGTVNNMQRFISATAKRLEGITRELQRIEAEHYFGYTPAMLDIQELVGSPREVLEDRLPADIRPPGNHLRIEWAEYTALRTLSKIRKVYPILGGGCGLTQETAILLPKALPNYIGVSHKIFTCMFHDKPGSQALISCKSRTYDILKRERPRRHPRVLWFDITEHYPSR